MTISANEVKQRGVSIFDTMLNKFGEVFINVRGKNKYVVVDIQRYKELRESELDLAYIKTMQDIKNEKYTTNLDEHLEDVKKTINEL